MPKLVRKTPEFGWIEITSSGSAITHLCFLGDDASPHDDGDDLCHKAWHQVEEWCHGKRQEFDLPLAPEVSSYPEKWLDALAQIPYGETETYSDLALRWGDLNLARIAGNQCARNPIRLIIPCHRITNKADSKSYSGIKDLSHKDPRNLALKQALIDHERRYSQRGGGDSHSSPPTTPSSSSPPAASSSSSSPATSSFAKWAILAVVIAWGLWVTLRLLAD